MKKEKLLGKNFRDFQTIINELSLPKYTVNQLIEWIYKKHVSNFDEMTNLSKQTRDLLKNKFETGIYAPEKESVSSDGTKKYLFKIGNSKFIETAVIPDEERLTVCVSTQIGCKMACSFCLTGKQGFQGNVSVSEILNQIISIPESDKISNIVFMGMGEPLDNLKNVIESITILTSEYAFSMSPRRITVSTIGILPELKELIEKTNCHIAISLHHPFEQERVKIMPIEKVHPIRKIIELLKEYDFGKQRRISFEYIMFKGFNDMPLHIKEMARMLNSIRCRVNLIRFHQIPGCDLIPSDNQMIQIFKDALNQKGILTTIRESKGEDILAACGMLSTKQLNNKIT